jgi:hypothetical protein
MHARRVMSKVALSLALAVALAGCGSSDDKDTTATPTSAPAPTAPQLAAPAGFTVISDPASKFAIAVPETWTQLPLDAATFDSVAEALRTQNPQLAQTLQQAKSMVGSGGKVFALDPADNGATNVNLIVTPAQGITDLDEVAKQATSELGQVGATGITQERTTLAGGDAVKAKFTLNVNTPDGPKQVQETQYYVIRNDTAYILTLVGEGPATEAIAQSLTIG